MQTTIELNTDALDGRLEESLKRLFPHRDICIVAYDVTGTGPVTRDATEELLSDPARRERLLRAVADVQAGRNLVTPDQSLFA